MIRPNRRSGGSQFCNFCACCQGLSTWTLHRGSWERRLPNPHVSSLSTWTHCLNSSIPIVFVLICPRQRQSGRMQPATGPRLAWRNTHLHWIVHWANPLLFISCNVIFLRMFLLIKSFWTVVDSCMLLSLGVTMVLTTIRNEIARDDQLLLRIQVATPRHLVTKGRRKNICLYVHYVIIYIIIYIYIYYTYTYIYIYIYAIIYIYTAILAL